MKVSLGSIEVDDVARRAIRRLTDGDGRKASREEVRAFLLKAATATLESVIGEHVEACGEDANACGAPVRS